MSKESIGCAKVIFFFTICKEFKVKRKINNFTHRTLKYCSYNRFTLWRSVKKVRFSKKAFPRKKRERCMLCVVHLAPYRKTESNNWYDFSNGRFCGVTRKVIAQRVHKCIFLWKYYGEKYKMVDNGVHISMSEVIIFSVPVQFCRRLSWRIASDCG